MAAPSGARRANHAVAPVTWIALFRGINVGGNNLLPMTALRELIENLGGTRVRTYIQSGNVVFRCGDPDAAQLTKRIEAAVQKQYGVAARVVLLTADALERAIEANPFRHAESAPKTLHLAFLAAQPAHPDFAGLDAIRADKEAYALEGGVFYLHVPDGAGQSKLAARYEKLLGVPATSRNWNTVTKLREMANE